MRDLQQLLGQVSAGTRDDEECPAASTDVPWPESRLSSPEGARRVGDVVVSVLWSGARAHGWASLEEVSMLSPVSLCAESDQLQATRQR